jgi:uncharacterized protein DUF3800
MEKGAPESVRELTAVMFSRFRREGLMLVLNAYLDESNSNKDGEVCVVAGFLGSEKQFENCSEEWQAILDRRKRKPLHMCELRWNENARKLLAELGPVPDRHGLKRIMGVVRNADYRDLVAQNIPDHLGVPYVLSMQACIAHVLRYLPARENVEFVFEKHSVYHNSAQVVYDAVFELNREKHQLRSLTHVRRDACVALQPADYLAYELSQFYANRDSKRAIWGRSILGNGEIHGAQLDREQIRQIVNAFVAFRRSHAIDV